MRRAMGLGLLTVLHDGQLLANAHEPPVSSLPESRLLPGEKSTIAKCATPKTMPREKDLVD